ncbi:tartrate dehydrogenase [Stemphylium lycopersici]|nr:tartrate dehydrogenase [Stemphylium lycopersici]
MSQHTLKIAVIPGDGIGTEVMPLGVRCLKAAASVYGLSLEFEEFDFASCNYYSKHGDMMPKDWKETLSAFDAIYFGAVGMPDLVPDHITLWGSLLKFRREFDQYISLRPCRLMPGVPCPLANKQPGDIDFWVVRENTEGEYSSIGGKIFEGTEREVVMQETVMTRIGVDRVLKYALDLAKSRPKKHLTSATKSNGISITMPYWDERLQELSAQGDYGDLKIDKFHIDILTAWLVLRPEQFDVMVGSNLFGDILSDLGPACTGTIGIAPSANINPEGKFPSLFEPVHGSAPDICGKGIANPIGMIWAGQMMLEHFGFKDAAATMLTAIERVLSKGETHVLTPDMGGKSGTTESLGAAIESEILGAPPYNHQPHTKVNMNGTSLPRILFFNPVRHAVKSYEALQTVADTEVVTSASRQEFFTDVGKKYGDIKAIYRTSASGAVAGNFDKEFIDHLPPSLKFICHNGAGYDQIDVDACAARGITVTYAPDPVTAATADLTLFLLLGALRQLNPSFNQLRSGQFKKGVNFGHDPQGKTLGILGMGRIGRAVKARADPFGLKTVYHNRKPLSPDLAAGCAYVSFDQLLAESDIISIHVPLSAATKHLVGRMEINKMKKGVVIVNTARGAIIEEAAMAEALDEGHVAAVGLDVYEREPVIDERLIKNERALLVPHLGTHTVETLAKMEAHAMENARRAVLGEELLSVVPEHLAAQGNA